MSTLKIHLIILWLILLVLTKTILDIGNSQNLTNYEEVILEKEQIKKETATDNRKSFFYL